MSSTVGAPAVAPTTSAAPPVFAPDGSGLSAGAVDAAAGAGAVSSACPIPIMSKLAKITTKMMTLTNLFDINVYLLGSIGLQHEILIHLYSAAKKRRQCAESWVYHSFQSISSFLTTTP
jgi:hypothetical protein